MSKLIAKGKYYNEEVIVECELIDGKFSITLNGEYDEAVERDFLEYMKSVRPLGGTYYPPKNTLLAAYSVLTQDFFDDSRKVRIEVIGEIEQIPTIEGDEDIVY